MTTKNNPRLRGPGADETPDAGGFSTASLTQPLGIPRGTAYDRITDALRAHHKTVRQTGPCKATAQCPAHEDRNPSLSIKRIEGQVLVYCHAGCDNLDVMAALGLSKSDFYDNPRGPTYTYDDGRSVHRTPDKLFRQSGNTNGQQTTLYRLGEIQKALADDRMIFFVEGEKDVHAIESLGEIATTAPMGASNVDKCDLSPLHGGRVIVIVDRDQAGEDRAQYIRGALNGKTSVEFAQSKVGKDVSDHIAAGYGLDELEEWTPKAALRLVEAVDVIISRVRFLWANRIPLGAFTLIPGEEGVGKTTINTWIIAHVTRGTLPGELFGQPRHVIIIAPEDHREAVVVPRLKEAGADLKLVTFIDARIYGDSEHSITIPRDLDEIAKVCVQRNTALVVIDSFVTTLPETMKSISYKDTATVLKALGVFAEATDVAVIAPWHLNKGGGSDTALRMMDSRGFRTAARSILLAVGDPEKHGEVIVALDMANGASLDTPAVRFQIDVARYTVEEIDKQTGGVRYIPATCSVAKHIGVETGNGRDLARKMLTPAMARDCDPKAWLLQYLTDRGPTMRDQVMKAAEAAGFSERQMQRAAKALRVRYKPHTVKRPNSTPLRKDEWSLPDDNSDDDSDSDDTRSRQSHHTPTSGTTVATEALGRVKIASSSLVRNGGDGHAARVDVRESGTTANRTVATAPCDFWTDGNHCGNPDSRRYMNGWRCNRHTPERTAA